MEKTLVSRYNSRHDSTRSKESSSINAFTTDNASLFLRLDSPAAFYEQPVGQESVQLVSS